jgi:hypothetical protein
MSTAIARRRQRAADGRTSIASLGLAAVLALAAAAPVTAATRYDPRLRFRSIVTAHFTIYFHQGEDVAARRLARVTEEVARQLEPRFGRPARRVHVILVDQSDVSNGWATPIPHNTIEVAAAPPRGADLLGNTDDWLRLVFAHEYTHILHLDRSRGLFGGLRRVFGRHPAAYPNLFLPLWQIEGIATFEESAVTGRGRLPAGDFQAILSGAAGAGRFAPLDRASTAQVEWPAGHTPYLYGGYFHQYLADRYGAASLVRLADATAGRIPYLGARAFRDVFGRSLGDLWDDFESATRARGAAAGTAGTRLTHHGFTVASPRFAGDGRLFYSAANPHGFPALMERSRPGGPPKQIARRYLGNRLSVSGSVLVFDQLEVVRSVGLQSDLYAVSLDTGASRRLTRGARAADPDVSPDGRTIVCTVQLADRRALATVVLPPDGRTGAPTLLVSEPQTDFASPRWSPDGRTIAAERRQLGGPSEIVLVDATTAEIRPLLGSDDARSVDPAWTADGRTLLYASDRAGAFRIYAVDIVTRRVRQMPGVSHDAKAPESAPDGRTLVYVGGTPDGYDLFSVPFDLDTWTDVDLRALPSTTQLAFGSGAPESPAGPLQASTDGKPYGPWATLVPQYWTPVVESDDGETTVGAATSGTDALGRHAYVASAAWSASRARPDWNAGYVYDRWLPALFANLSDDTSPWREGRVRAREAEAGVLLPLRRVRSAQAFFGSLYGSTDRFGCDSCSPVVDEAIDRRSVRGGWRFTSARSYGFSISREEGTDAGVTIELTRRALGADGNAGAAAWDVRHYLPLAPRHGVFAARAAAATAWGDEPVRRRFSAGGAGPQPGGFRFGSDAVGLLRGFDEPDVAGRHAAVVNLDYRLPVLRVERGAGTWPVFLRVAHAALFVDAGHAWDDRFAPNDVRASLGAELSFDTVVGYAVPLTLSTGVAWRVRGPRDERGAVVFGRLGRAF